MTPATEQPSLAQLQQALPAESRVRLAHILARAQADCDHIVYALGTGAPSTLRRVRALQMALDGESIPAIAAAVSLPEARVRQVLANVLAQGEAALYPSFVETEDWETSWASQSTPITGGALWAIVGPIIKTPPPKHGAFAGKWTPALVLDFLIHQGTLSDASIHQLAAFITHIRNRQSDNEKASSLCYDESDDINVPEKTASPLATGGLFVAGIAVVGIGASTHSIAVMLFGILFAAVSGLGLFKAFQERLLLKKVLSHAPPAPAASAVPDAAPAPANLNPPPPITIGHVLSLAPTPWETAALTDTANALNQPPRRILYLWVFQAQSEQRVFETEGWPQLGSVHMLLNATALTINQLNHASKDLLVQDQAALRSTVQAYTDSADSYLRPNLFYTMSLGKISKSIYRGYPIHTLVCTDSTWQQAFYLLAERCDLAIVNLSGYNPQHPGLEFEIHHLLSGNGPRRFVFLYERRTDADAVIEAILSIWSRLPNPVAPAEGLLFLRVPDSQDVGYGTQFQKPATGLGWLANTVQSHEGEYIPIAGRILAELDRRSKAN